ncbi:MAG: hypothetical protein M3Z95_00635, partial [Actinomycetota bacterium]|nr:hypothetical protein [Actinomycetota bacterium]
RARNSGEEASGQTRTGIARWIDLSLADLLDDMTALTSKRASRRAQPTQPLWTESQGLTQDFLGLPDIGSVAVASRKPVIASREPSFADDGRGPR